jgi:hypothetical protein
MHFNVPQNPVTHFEAEVPCETPFFDPLGKGSREIVLLLASLLVAPSLGFPRAALSLEMDISRR